MLKERQIAGSRRREVFFFLESEGLRSEVRGTEKWRTENRRTQKDQEEHNEQRAGQNWTARGDVGKGLSVKGAENKDDDVCDRRKAGFQLWLT